MTERPLIFHLPKPDFEAAKESGTVIRLEVFGFHYNSWTCRRGRSVLIKRTWQKRDSLQGRIVLFGRLNSIFLEIDEAFEFSRRNGDQTCDVAMMVIRIDQSDRRVAA